MVMFLAICFIRPSFFQWRVIHCAVTALAANAAGLRATGSGLIQSTAETLG
jgi:hypothetical protein